jgi:hypothetical protein
MNNVTYFKIGTLKPEQIGHVNCYLPVNRALRVAKWKTTNASFASFAGGRALSN